jgi:hypothetical protein
MTQLNLIYVALFVVPLLGGMSAGGLFGLEPDVEMLAASFCLAVCIVALKWLGDFSYWLARRDAESKPPADEPAEV